MGGLSNGSMEWALAKVNRRNRISISDRAQGRRHTESCSWKDISVDKNWHASLIGSKYALNTEDLFACDQATVDLSIKASTHHAEQCTV
jgi:hypothetical protein